MTTDLKKPIQWSLEACLSDALKYATRSDWDQESGSAYTFARQNGLLDLCCSHMKLKNTWTKEKCIQDAKKYKTRTEWNRKSRGGYDSAYRKGYLDMCCSHMPILYQKKSNGSL